MAGWRCGFCSGNAEIVKALATIKGYYDYGMFAPIQIASVIAMREHAQTPVKSAPAKAPVEAPPPPADAQAIVSAGDRDDATLLSEPPLEL